MPEKTAIIFGDSIMKGTVYEGGRYRSCYTEVFLPQMEGLDIAAPASATPRNAGWGSLKRPSLPGKGRITPWWNTAGTTATSTGRP